MFLENTFVFIFTSEKYSDVLNPSNNVDEKIIQKLDPN